MSQIRSLIKYKNSKRIWIKKISETKPKIIRRYCINSSNNSTKGYIFHSWVQ